MEIQLNNKIIQKYKSRSIPWLLNKATKHFNLWIRTRDREGEYFTCISCSTTKRIKNYANGSNYHAGHYFPSTVSALKYNEINVNSQCGKCNTHGHGNQINYRHGLVRKYGEESVKELEQLEQIYKRTFFKWDRFALIEIIEKYKLRNKNQNT